MSIKLGNTIKIWKVEPEHVEALAKVEALDRLCGEPEKLTVTEHKEKFGWNVPKVTSFGRQRRH